MTRLLTKIRVLVIDENVATHNDYRKILTLNDQTSHAIAAIKTSVFGESPISSINLPDISIDATTDAQQGVQMIREAIDSYPYVVAFVDIKKPPEWEGVQTIEEIWAIDPQIQIVVCTSSADYSWVAMVEKLGITDRLVILRKPFDEIELRQLTLSLIEKSRLNHKLNRQSESLQRLIEERTHELQKNNIMKRAMLDASPDAIALFNSKNELIYYNKQLVKLFHISNKIIDSNDYAKLLKYILGQIIQSAGYMADLQQSTLVNEAGKYSEMLLKDNRLIEYYLQALIIKENEIGKLCIFRDVTLRREIEEKLWLHDRALDACPHGILIADAFKPDFPIIYSNPAFEKITGYTVAEVLGRNCRFLQGADRDQMDLFVLKQALEKGQPVRVILRNYRKDGGLFWNELHVSPLIDATGNVTHFIGVIIDITAQKFLENQLMHQATHDTLTGLPNRLLLLDRIEQAVLHAKRNEKNIAILFFDLDQFKYINDSLGHQVGDMLLHAVASRLADCVRESDTVARLGGDEFVIVIADLAAPEDAITVIEKSRQALMVPFYIEDQELALTTSIGVSYYPKDGDDPDSLLRNADIAMYYAKEAGGDAFRIYSPTMNTLARERVEFENSLRKALERQEFVLYYQPVISLDTGKIVCAEVLLRWQNPKLGLVMPQEFIPITEDTGLIGPLGEWLLQEACAQTKQWQLEGFAPIKIAVNLSAKQFNQGDVADMVEKILVKTGLPPEYLELELTESMIMENSELIIGMLWKLKKQGVTVVIDDFGTGYSSLSALKRLPVDKIKIDKTFVKHISSNPNDASIILAIISMAGSMGLKILAEGVETEDQLRFLQLHHCNEVQGYYFSEPVTAEAFTQMLKERLKFEV